MECCKNVLLQNIPYIMDDYLWSREIKKKKKKNCPNLLKYLPEPVDAVFKMYTFQMLKIEDLLSTTISR